MLHPDDISRFCLRKYPAFLRSIVTGETFFPFDIRFGRLSASADWNTLRAAIAALCESGLGYRVEWVETNTRRWGRQRFPDRVWFQNEEDFLRAIQKSEEIKRYRAKVDLTREICPELLPWVAANPTQVVEFEAVWADLLKVCCYLYAHPRPGVYARELPVEVDTKFVERHQGILCSLLDFLLPEHARTESDVFAERFGLRREEALIRFRLLDSGLKRTLGIPFDDLTVPVSEFRSLCLFDLDIIITENKLTFLTVPGVPNALGIWGGGGAAELLATARWLARCRLFYWGDLDVHGFHILSRLRRTFPGIVSLLMTESELDRYSHLAVPARPATYEDVSGLTLGERRAYERLRSGLLLLEQERIPQIYIVQAIRLALSA
jgi:hypothetical protein